MCLLLRRLAYPLRLHDIEDIFGKHLSVLSRHFNAALDHVYDRFIPLLLQVDQLWLSKESLLGMALAASRRGSPFNRCAGFNDGTNIEICVQVICNDLERGQRGNAIISVHFWDVVTFRPGNYHIQKLCYSEYSHEHDLKYSAVKSANGFFINIHGPEPGSPNDSGMLNLRHLEKPMAQSPNFNPIGGKNFTSMEIKHTAQRLTSCHLSRSWPLKRRTFPINKWVEWEFVSNEDLENLPNCGLSQNLFKNQKLFLQPMAKCFLVAALLTNCHTCFYGSLPSSFFFACTPVVGRLSFDAIKQLNLTQSVLVGIKFEIAESRTCLSYHLCIENLMEQIFDMHHYSSSFDGLERAWFLCYSLSDSGLRFWSSDSIFKRPDSKSNFCCSSLICSYSRVRSSLLSASSAFWTSIFFTILCFDCSSFLWS